jgi:S1-C subfamily serine protease
MGKSIIGILIATTCLGAEKIDIPPQVVRIYVMDKDGSPCYGTGALLGETMVLTNNHVVRNRKSDDSIKVIFSDWTIYDAKIIKTDPEPDLAALRLDSKAHVKPLEIGELPKVGDVVKFIGYGSGLPAWKIGKVTSQGFNKSVNQNEADVDMGHEVGPLIEVDAGARHGDSGSPILNEKGQYVGTLFASNGVRTIGAHVDTVLKFLGWERSNAKHYLH